MKVQYNEITNRWDLLSSGGHWLDQFETETEAREFMAFVLDMNEDTQDAG